MWVKALPLLLLLLGGTQHAFSLPATPPHPQHPLQIPPTNQPQDTLIYNGTVWWANWVNERGGLLYQKRNINAKKKKKKRKKAKEKKKKCKSDFFEQISHKTHLFAMALYGGRIG